MMTFKGQSQEKKILLIYSSKVVDNKRFVIIHHYISHLLKFRQSQSMLKNLVLLPKVI